MKNFLIDPQTSVPIYEQIISQIKMGIKEKELVPGDVLPPIRQLATDLELNPNTVAKAYKTLEKENLISTARSKGTFVADSAFEILYRNQLDNFEKSLQELVQEMKESGLSLNEVKTYVEKSYGK